MATPEIRSTIKAFAEYLCALDGEASEGEEPVSGRCIWKQGRKLGAAKNAAAPVRFAAGDDPVKLAKRLEQQFDAIAREYPRFYLTAYLEGQSGAPYHNTHRIDVEDTFPEDEPGIYSAPSLDLNDHGALFGAFAHSIERTNRHLLNQNHDLAIALHESVRETSELRGQVIGLEMVTHMASEWDRENRMAAIMEQLPAILEKVAPALAHAYAVNRRATAQAEKAQQASSGEAPAERDLEVIGTDLYALLTELQSRYTSHPEEFTPDAVEGLAGMLAMANAAVANLQTADEPAQAAA